MLDPAILKNDIESLELNIERRNLDIDLKELTALLCKSNQVRNFNFQTE